MQPGEIAHCFLFKNVDLVNTALIYNASLFGTCYIINIISIKINHILFQKCGYIGAGLVRGAYCPEEDKSQAKK